MTGIKLRVARHGHSRRTRLRPRTDETTQGGGTEVSFTVGGMYKMTGISDAQNQVECVQSWID